MKETNFTTPAHIFAWAESLADGIEEVEKVIFPIDRFLTEIDYYSALFHSKSSNKTLLCCYDKEENSIYFWEVMNFKQLISEHRDLTLLYLKNGEELYRKLTGDISISHKKMIFPA